jgi:DNA adenine methylase
MVKHIVNSRLTELELAESPWSRSARLVSPLFRWAGGKQRFLWHHKQRLPSFEGRYFEPFAGGLSVYFHYVSVAPRPFSASIGDINLRLIRCYKEVAGDPDGVADRLEALVAGYEASANREAFYYDVREQHNRMSPRADAARFIFLMAAGWNGVYRSNSSGEFNVPHGSVKSLRVPTREQLLAVALVFGMADIRARSWEGTISTARPGDFVFLDPPYGIAGRRDLYDRSQQFLRADQTKLAHALVDLQRRGVDFMLTNSADPELELLYRSLGLRVDTISVMRSVSAHVDSRESDAEVIVTPNRDWSTVTAYESETMVGIQRLNWQTKGGDQL